MHSRFSSKLTLVRLVVIAIATFVAFGTIQQSAFAKSFSCPPASALCHSQLESGQAAGPPVGRSMLKGMPGLSILGTNPAHYYYVGGYQYFAAQGASGYFNQDAPYLAQGDAHSLAELAVESADGKQIVEVGWTVDKPGAGPSLFVFAWINGKPTCYNTCGFVHIANTPTPGAPVGVDSNPNDTHQYVIRFYQGNWWIWYGYTWIGYFPGSLWHNQFTQIGLTWWFGEVATYQSYPCSQMGNGTPGANNWSALINHMYFIVNGSAINATAHEYQSTPGYYDGGHFSPGTTGFNSFTFGGAGDTNPKDCSCEFCLLSQKVNVTQQVGILPRKIIR